MFAEGSVNDARTGVPLARDSCHDARALKLRPLLFVVCAFAAACLTTPTVRAQSQGVGLTVEGGTQPGASQAGEPSASPGSGSPSGGSTIPTSNTGDGTVVQGTTTTPGTSGGSGDPLPRTGLDVLRLLTIGLGSITLGQVMVRAARRAHA